MNISVITVVRNAENCIKDTINSILSQTVSDFEYIIADGLSTDKTYEIICSYDGIFKKRGIVYKHYSEKDAGIYDAMNKATQIATGKYVNYMNAGDMFCDSGVLKDVEEFININKSAVVIYGDVVELINNKECLIKAKNIETIRKHMPFCHQSCFTDRIVAQNNPYDCRYKIVADYELYLRLYINNFEFVKIDRTICKYRTDGISRKEPYRTYCENVNVKVQHNIIDKRSIRQKIINFYYKNLFVKGMPFHKLALIVQSSRLKL